MSPCFTPRAELGIHPGNRFILGRLNYINVIVLECWTAPCMSGRFYIEPQEQRLFVCKEVTGIRRIEQIVYKYRASPTVRSIDFIIQCTIPKRFIPQVDKLPNWLTCSHAWKALFIPDSGNRSRLFRFAISVFQYASSRSSRVQY
jgi:hypothetical protein